MRIRVEFDVPNPPRRRSRRLLAIAALGLALVLPSVALASHLFTDVPNGNTFHSDISALAESGVTAGCGPTTYCPDQAVTRGQMAAFLHRGLSRVTRNALGTGPVGTTTNDVFDTFTITPGIPPGAMDGATQFVEVTVAMSVNLTDATGCPCLYRANLRLNGEFINDRTVDLTLTTEDERMPMTVIGVGPVTGSGPATVEVIIYRASGSGSASMYGTAIATTHAYGGTGGSVLSDAGNEPAGADEASPE